MLTDVTQFSNWETFYISVKWAKSQLPHWADYSTVETFR